MISSRLNLHQMNKAESCIAHLFARHTIQTNIFYICYHIIYYMKHRKKHTRTTSSGYLLWALGFSYLLYVHMYVCMSMCMCALICVGHTSNALISLAAVVQTKSSIYCIECSHDAIVPVMATKCITFRLTVPLLLPPTYLHISRKSTKAHQVFFFFAQARSGLRVIQNPQNPFVGGYVKIEEIRFFCTQWEMWQWWIIIWLECKLFRLIYMYVYL